VRNLILIDAIPHTAVPLLGSGYPFHRPYGGEEVFSIPANVENLLVFYQTRDSELRGVHTFNFEGDTPLTMFQLTTCRIQR
jgi:hypothetical protein